MFHSNQTLVAPGVSSTTNGWFDEFMEACDALGCRFAISSSYLSHLFTLSYLSYLSSISFLSFLSYLSASSNHRIDYLACHSYVLAPKAQIKKLQEFSERWWGQNSTTICINPFRFGGRKIWYTEFAMAREHNEVNYCHWDGVSVVMGTRQFSVATLGKHCRCKRVQCRLNSRLSRKY